MIRASHFDGDDATMTQPQAARTVRFTDGSVQRFVKISQDALPWRLTGSTLNGHNLRQESLVVFLRDDARNHAPSPEVVIYSDDTRLDFIVTYIHISGKVINGIA